jgi:tetratricopeptide (TPR) repeat protein
MGPLSFATLLAVMALPVRQDATGPEVTFSEHVAPLVYRRCLPCHRAGESGPFELLTYDDVAKRKGQILQVVRARYMPPWMPTPGRNEFVGDRSLSDEELATLERWVAAGAPEGDPAKAPPVPPATKGWYLGEPDLVVTMAEPFVVPPEGVDVFRNFVIPAPVEGTRFVEALELQPGNKRVAHHAVIQIDRTRASHERDALDPEPGFPGMDMGESEAPDGHFLGWVPGRVPLRAAPGMAWRLEPGSSLVVQMHMVPSGKPEPIQVSLGFFFTDQPPTQRLMVLPMRSDDIDIPAGESAYVVEDALTLDADVTVWRIAPHAHYLGKRIEAFADLPDGTRRDLILIEDWDFNWQDAYEYVNPLHLPKGTRLTMRYTCDNSADNPRNPHVPPVRVTVGNRSFDEMATLTLQLGIESDADRRAILKSEWRHRIEVNPDNWLSRLNLGGLLARTGRVAEAAEHLRVALALQPGNVDVRISMGGALAILGDLPGAHEQLEEALRLSPGHPEAHYNLARTEELQGHWRAAAQHYRAGLESSPRDARLHRGLAQVLLRLERPDEAVQSLEQARALDPADHASCYLLGRIAFRQGRLESATEAFLAGLAIHPLPEAHADLARIYRARGMKAEAREQAERAQELREKGER